MTAIFEERRSALAEELRDDDITPDRVDEIEAELRKIETEEAAQEKRQKLLGVVTKPAPVPVSTPAPQEVRIVSEPLRDIAEQFVASPGMENFRTMGMKGKVQLDLHGRSIREMVGLEVRAPMDNTATSAGAFQNPTRPSTVPATNADRPVRVADLLDRQTTGDNTVEYVRDTSAAGAGGAAAETAEAGAKPEASFTFEVVTDSVRTIAHWVQITRQAADDNEQLMGYIRGRLTYGLEYRLDAQILNGNGTAPNLRGILNTSGINTLAPAGAEARVISIRKAMTLVQQDEYAPTGAVLNPADWELVELSQDSQGMFRVSPNVQDALGPRIWGLRVASTTAIASGTGLVGDFRMGATLWDRQQPTVLLSDSHASTFTSNILTLLAELRAALSVWRPAAFTKITFNGTT